MQPPMFPSTLANLLATLTTATILLPTTSAAAAAPNPDPNPNQKPMIDSFRKSCVNWTIDPKACALKGFCKLTDDATNGSHPRLHGWHETSLDLNQCIWFDVKESKLKWADTDEQHHDFIAAAGNAVNFCKDFCDCWLEGGGVSGDMLDCVCDSGESMERKRDTWAAVNLSEYLFLKY